MYIKMKNVFTLIEMMVVIAIIAIVAAMLLPALENVVNTARDTTCMNNHHQLSMGVASYAGDYYGLIPYSVTSAGSKYARAYTMSAGTPNEHSYPNHYAGIGMLYEFSYIESASMFWCANEDAPRERTCSENTDGLARFITSVPPSRSIESNIWYRCGWVQQKNITEQLASIKFPNDGILMCGLTFSLKWELLHQNRGMNLSFADGHTSFFSYQSRLPPNLWGGSYNMFTPKSTLETASKAFHNAD